MIGVNSMRVKEFDPSGVLSVSKVKLVEQSLSESERQ